MGKVIGRFDPTPSRAPEECERHYTQVHVRMAQDLLRPMPTLLSYHTDRAVAQADVNGGWSQRPRAWRFVVLRFTPGATLAFTAEQNEMVAQDHVNCLYRLRSCDVEESVLLDRVDGQLALSKFMLEADRAPGVDADTAWVAFSRLADRVHAAVDRAFGVRRLTVNRVLSEVECEPLDVEGQRPIGLLEDTTRVGYVEAYFDHPRWGEEALGTIAGGGALRDPALVDVNLLRVEELGPIDVTGG
ncbi:MAG TPA: hypothetical protein VMJ65_05305 [Solirubrobacteraceae bacterium]|nr:hypothetical protein [Solirubrobacteraceae bacterium]